MIPALNAALVNAAGQHKDGSIEARLRAGGALSHATAISIELASSVERRQLDNGIAKGIYGRDSDGRIWLNVRALDERRAMLGWMVLIAALVIGSAFASLLALTVLR